MVTPLTEDADGEMQVEVMVFGRNPVRYLVRQEARSSSEHDGDAWNFRRGFERVVYASVKSLGQEHKYRL